MTKNPAPLKGDGGAVNWQWDRFFFNKLNDDWHAVNSNIMLLNWKSYSKGSETHWQPTSTYKEKQTNAKARDWKEIRKTSDQQK